jgi:hypothetical protein
VKAWCLALRYPAPWATMSFGAHLHPCTDETWAIMASSVSLVPPLGLLNEAFLDAPVAERFAAPFLWTGSWALRLGEAAVLFSMKVTDDALALWSELWLMVPLDETTLITIIG